MVGREQPASGIHLHTCDPARTSRTVDSDRVLSCTAVFDLTRYLQLYGTRDARNCQLPYCIDIVTSPLTAESAAAPKLQAPSAPGHESASPSAW